MEINWRDSNAIHTIQKALKDAIDRNTDYFEVEIENISSKELTNAFREYFIGNIWKDSAGDYWSTSAMLHGKEISVCGYPLENTGVIVVER